MCGIFGVFAAPGSNYPEAKLKDIIRTIAVLSESRGKESSGFAFRKPLEQSIDVMKAPVPSSELVTHQLFTTSLREALTRDSNGNSTSTAIIGHSRLVTNGSQLAFRNNQPVTRDGVVAVHNGIIVNAEDLWRRYPDLQRAAEIDTELIPALTRKALSETHHPQTAISVAVQHMSGTLSLALIFADRDEALIATNCGSLYALSNERDFVAFASEKHILRELASRTGLSALVGDYSIRQIAANTGLHLDLSSFRFDQFPLNYRDALSRNGHRNGPQPVKAFQITEQDVLPDVVKSQRASLVDINTIGGRSEAKLERAMLEYHIDAISQIKRCVKCILPVTFPFIDFDAAGVCNFCRNHISRKVPRSFDALRDLVAPYKRTDGEPDCLVPFSGGRDSTYALHLAKKELGLNPVALTYDWGMVTDLARRNIARTCGKLGVENIIVSADIRQKRDNIRKNILAWLKYPQLGMTPLFMAGDKFFFYYAHTVKRQLGIRLNLWGINPLENTDFKVGYCGVRPNFVKKRIYSLDAASHLRLFAFVGRNVARCPAYINGSVPDTFGSFLVRYAFPKRDYYHVFDYHRWDENTIVDTITSEYDWERAIDTQSTWRIGDGTASFYNYIYTTVSGFSENDTFRSNQIRQGMIARDRALELVVDENKPRYESLKWYLEIVGLPYQPVIQRINDIPKRYSR